MVCAFVPTVSGLRLSAKGQTAVAVRQSSFEGQWGVMGRPAVLQVRPGAKREMEKGRGVGMQMVTAETARIGIAIYGVLIAGGGVGAFLKSGSKPSIVSGVISGIVLAAAYSKDSVPTALITAVVLSIVFAIRFFKSKKFIPAGLLCLLSIAATVFFAISYYG